MFRKDTTITQEEQDFFQELKKQGKFDIKSCEVNIDFDDKKRFEMLQLTSEQKMHISELLQHMPTVTAAGTIANAYTVSFPKGLPHTLISLKQGGFGSQIIGNGKKIVGSASFYPMFGQAAVLSIFTALSIVTGQFFLAQIRKELHTINKKLDEILKFLYGEKKAELLSEVNFIKYACDNYTFIMAREQQQIATIASIQNSKKVAMKDIDFYLNDLRNKIESGEKQNFQFLANLMDNENEIKQIKENLDLSLQLYLMSSLMEVYYAQNYENEYIINIENEIKNCLTNSKQQIISMNGELKGYLGSCKVSSKDTQNLQEHKQELKKSEDLLEKEYTALYDKMSDILHKATQNTEYYIKTDGSVYYKKEINL